ncbi:hypothetical protein AB0I45_07280 [Brevibacterium sp. NPDC049920]|uniref:Uncharacterized protein n=1 Tax=Brevibacterium pityocampae TaxID=506594 RepID=A0ABP8J4M4_9MICO
MTEIPRPWVDDRAMKPYSALVVPVSAAVDTSLVRTLVTAFEGHEFSVVESILGSGDRLQALIDDAASSFDVLVTIGGLRANGDPDIADILRTEIEVEVPGLSELLRREQYAAGHRAAVFENLVCGRIDGTLVVTLPDRAEAVAASAELLAGLASEMLAELDEPPADGLEFDLETGSGETLPWPVVVDDPHPDATILQMWNAERRPQSGAGEGPAEGDEEHADGTAPAGGRPTDTALSDTMPTDTMPTDGPQSGSAD